MKIDIRREIECCEGNPEINRACYRNGCPLYQEARVQVDRSQPRVPYVGTGFGSLYGEPKRPTEAQYLAKVRENLQAEAAKANAEVVEPTPTPKGQE